MNIIIENLICTNYLIIANIVSADRKFLDVIDFGEGTCTKTEDCDSAVKYCVKPSFGFDAAPTKVELKFPGIPIKIF